MRVVELLPVFNEVDVLAARVELMAGHVAQHVVAEGDLTHQGHPKPFYLDGVDLPATVTRTKVSLPTGEGDKANWQRENDQRDALTVGIPDDPDTLVLSCDCDEIVVPDALERIWQATEHGPVSLGMRMIYYGTREHRSPWPAAKAFRARHTPPSLSTLRLTPHRMVPDCGWHLSYLGDTSRRRAKVEAFAHAENRAGPAWERVAGGEQGPNGEPLVPFNPADLPTPLRRLVIGQGP